MALTDTENTNNKSYPRDVKLLETKVVELQAAVTALVALITELKADYNAHVHGGITAGAASSDVSDRQTSAADVVL